MKRFALAILGLFMLLGPLTPAVAQLSIGVSIGINVPVYPALRPIPGYPVYYAPGLDANYFFYDGLYWVYEGDNWYQSSWYNGPWILADRFAVPVFLLRVPVRYYRHAPAYFHGWAADRPPRWGEHWGHSWEERRRGWDRWNRRSVPAPAPLPSYQRQYSGNRYPQPSQQAVIQNRNYRYQPRDAVARQHFQQQRAQAQQAAPRQQGAPRQQPAPRQQVERPRPQQPQQAQPQHQQAPAARERQAPRPQAQRAPQGKAQDRGHDKGPDRGRRDQER